METIRLTTFWMRNGNGKVGIISVWDEFDIDENESEFLKAREEARLTAANNDSEFREIIVDVPLEKLEKAFDPVMLTL